MFTTVWSLCKKRLRKLLFDIHGTETIIYEIVDELMHKNADRFQLDRETKELEAEAVAYVISAHFEFQDPSSQNYLALWHADADTITARSDPIRTVSTQIINAIDR